MNHAGDCIVVCCRGSFSLFFSLCFHNFLVDFLATFCLRNKLAELTPTAVTALHFKVAEAPRTLPQHRADGLLCKVVRRTALYGAMYGWGPGKRPSPYGRRPRFLLPGFLGMVIVPRLGVSG